MSLEQSPPLDDFEDVISKTPEATPKKKNWLRIVIAGLALLVAIIFFQNTWESELSTFLRGTGTVRGIALNEQGLAPQEGIVLILGTKLRGPIAENGSFELRDVPSGHQSLIVLDRYTGQEIKIYLEQKQNLDVGTIRLPTNVTPEP